ncbi:MAG: cytochrome P450 [bacterium]|nr:cytochrome P450 [bacterium]
MAREAVWIHAAAAWAPYARGDTLASQARSAPQPAMHVETRESENGLQPLRPRAAQGSLPRLPEAERRASRPPQRRDGLLDAVAQFDPAKPSGIHPSNSSGPAFEVARYFAGFIEERRKRPQDDLISILLAIDVNGRSLTQGELIGFGFLLLVAGHETTTNLISNALILLDQYPEARAKLLADPSLIPGAIEECLRFEAPVQGLARTTTRAVELHGQTIPADEMVLLLYGSANRDERKFEVPERFDVTRKPNEHLSFGFGSHFCLGSGLARLEGRVAFEELLARVPDYHLRSDSVERMTSGPIRGAVRLPVDLGL